MSKFTHTTNQEFFDSLDRTKPQLIEVASNPHSEGKPQKLWFTYLYLSEWCTYLAEQETIDRVKYCWIQSEWINGDIPCRLITEEKPTMKTIVFKNADEFYKSDLWKTEDQIIEAWVENNPFGKGKKAKIPFKKAKNCVDSFPGQRYYLINDTDYAWAVAWHDDYGGTFTVEIPTTEPKIVNYENIRPVPYKVGDWVEVLENIRECPKFNDWRQTIQNLVGQKIKIDKVYDDYSGVYYLFDNYYFPHYCLKKTTPPTPTKKRIKLRVTEDQIQQLKDLGFLDKNNKSS